MDTRIKTAYQKAMTALEAAAPTVEKTKGQQAAQTYKQLLEETCTRKNLGYKTLLEPAQQLAAAKGFIGWAYDEYADMWLNASITENIAALCDARDALDDLDTAIEEAEPEERGKQ